MERRTFLKSAGAAATLLLVEPSALGRDDTDARAMVWDGRGRWEPMPWSDLKVGDLVYFEPPEARGPRRPQAFPVCQVGGAPYLTTLKDGRRTWAADCDELEAVALVSQGRGSISCAAPLVDRLVAEGRL